MSNPALICGPGDTATVTALYAIGLSTASIIRLQQHAEDANSTLKQYIFYLLTEPRAPAPHRNYLDPARPLWQA